MFGGGGGERRFGDRGGFRGGGGFGRGRGRGGGGGDLNRRGLPKSEQGPPARFMPDNILSLFAARPEPEYRPPVKPHTFEPSTLSGVGSLVTLFEAGAPPPRVHDETPASRRAAKILARDARHAEELERAVAKWDPRADQQVYGDAYRTLFVGRLAFETTEKRLQREFEEFGAVARVLIVRDKEGMSRGYGFVEFLSEDDMKVAYRRADGRKIDGRRILVDVERGRTVPAWRPRKLGGGLGDTRRPLPRKPHKKDSWVRPLLNEYKVISLATKQRIAAEQQRAIDASLASSAFGAGTRAAYGGYSDRFDRDRHKAEREIYKAARKAAELNAQAAGTSEGEGAGVSAGRMVDEGEEGTSGASATAAGGASSQASSLSLLSAAVDAGSAAAAASSSATASSLSSSSDAPAARENGVSTHAGAVGGGAGASTAAVDADGDGAMARSASAGTATAASTDGHHGAATGGDSRVQAPTADAGGQSGAPATAGGDEGMGRGEDDAPPGTGDD